MTEDLPTWEEVRSKTEFTGLLVGNGASRAVWTGFNYESLFDKAQNVNETHRLSDADVALFDALRTRNFEHVLAGLATARHVMTALDIPMPALGERYTSIQKALAEAVKSTHVPWKSVPPTCLEAIRSELLNYQSVYSTNYDLIIYWAIMHEGKGGFKDFFWAKCFDLANTQLSGKSTVVLYLHGGLHLYRTASGGTIKRHAGPRSNLLDLFGTPLPDEDKDATPLFISEGSSDDKLASIQRSDYLSFAYTKLAHHDGPLCLFGHSLSDMDKHIVQALVQAEIHDIAISVRPGSREAVIAAKAKAHSKLPAAHLLFYDRTTHPLGATRLQIAL